ncbi:MAG: hypothetical protein RDV48_16955 [Candidatus Eremiobacteraeota bacterium]|nr:hypothetical protein [Candidatus Eremiobacteraeota bacterium]
MLTENFNLDSITELGEFSFLFAGNAVGGGEWWGVYLGSRCVFHLRAAHKGEIEAIYLKQKNYPYYSPTEKDHFFFFEDRLYHVNPVKVDPLAEMIILYFTQMTKKLKPEVKKIQREFGESLVKFDNLLKTKMEAVKKGGASLAKATPYVPSPQVPYTQPAVTPSFTAPSPQAAPSVPAATTAPPAITTAALPPAATPPAAPPGEPPQTQEALTAEQELQRQRMRERRKRLGLPEDLP